MTVFPGDFADDELTLCGRDNPRLRTIIRGTRDLGYQTEFRYWALAVCAFTGPRTHLYVIREGGDGPIKIGTAVKPRERLATLQLGNHRRLHLVLVIPGTQKLERFIHHELAREQVIGEWFRPSGRTRDIVEELTAWSEICADMESAGMEPDVGDVKSLVIEWLMRDWLGCGLDDLQFVARQAA